MSMSKEHPDRSAGAAQLDAERFRLYYKHNPIPSYIWQKAGDDFILKDYNDAAAVLTKNQIPELVGSKASALFKDRPGIFDDILRCFSEQAPFSREMPYRMITTGENKYLRVRYVFVPEDMVVVHTEDITEKHQVEEDLRAARAELEDRVLQREERFRALIGNIPGAVYRCACDKEWTIEFLSENIYDISGYPPSDFVGNKTRSYASIIHADDVAMVERIVFEQVKKREPFILEYRIMHKDGPIRWVYEKGRGVHDQDGNVLWLDGVIFDVTERKVAEEALRESEKELKKQKLALEQKNLALQEILGQIEIEKKQIKEGVVANVEELLLPALGKLRRKGSALDNKHIDLLEKSALQLTSGFGMRVSERRWKLTPREIEICSMIKNGLSSKEIAELINVSSRTIEIHRNNIRKKMGLSSKKINLTSYLQSF